MRQPETFTDLPKKHPRETWAAYNKRVAAWIASEDVGSKTDLRDWTGSLPFHLNREDP